MLSKYGAHSNVFNFKNETPFTIAAQSGDLDLIELLAPNTQRAIRGTFNRSESMMSLSGMMDDAGSVSFCYIRYRYELSIFPFFPMFCTFKFFQHPVDHNLLNEPVVSSKNVKLF